MPLSEEQTTKLSEQAYNIAASCWTWESVKNIANAAYEMGYEEGFEDGQDEDRFGS